MVNLLKDTKLVYSCFYDKNGNLLKEPEGKIGKLKLPKEHNEFLFSYIEFILNSKLLNAASIIYVKSPYESAKAVFLDYNKLNPDEEINLKTAASNLDYNRRKLHKVFDDDMLQHVIFYPRKADLGKYREQLEAAMVKYNRGTLFKGKLMIELPKTVGTERPTEDQIMGFMDAIQAYRTVNRRLIERTISEEYADVIKYFNYLSVCTNLDDWQKKMWANMKNYLNGRDQEEVDNEPEENMENEEDVDLDGFSFELDLPDAKTIT